MKLREACVDVEEDVYGMDLRKKGCKMEDFCSAVGARVEFDGRKWKKLDTLRYNIKVGFVDYMVGGRIKDADMGMVKNDLWRTEDKEQQKLSETIKDS